MGNNCQRCRYSSWLISKNASQRRKTTQVNIFFNCYSSSREKIRFCKKKITVVYGFNRMRRTEHVHTPQHRRKQELEQFLVFRQFSLPGRKNATNVWRCMQEQGESNYTKTVKTALIAILSSRNVLKANNEGNYTLRRP